MRNKRFGRGFEGVEHPCYVKKLAPVKVVLVFFFLTGAVGVEVVGEVVDVLEVDVVEV